MTCSWKLIKDRISSCLFIHLLISLAVTMFIWRTSQCFTLGEQISIIWIKWFSCSIIWSSPYPYLFGSGPIPAFLRINRFYAWPYISLLKALFWKQAGFHSHAPKRLSGYGASFPRFSQLHKPRRGNWELPLVGESDQGETPALLPCVRREHPRGKHKKWCHYRGLYLGR